MVDSFRASVFLFLQACLLMSIVCCLASQVPSATADGGRDDVGFPPVRRFAAEVPNGPIDNSTFTLAAERTNRKDPLNHFNRYTGGWNISNQHYWASVGFTAAPFFVIAAGWFVVFGLVLFFTCCCYFCCPQKDYSYSRLAYGSSLVFLILFTIAVIFGCVVLYTGQGKFHTSTSKTLDYVVGQANITVENVRNLSDNLAAAKKVRVEKILLSPDLQAKIDSVQQKLNTSANDLAFRANDNSKKIHDVLDKVRLQLIIIAAVMLALAFIGFLCSILGLQFIVSILVLIGWVLVAGTFISTGIFLLMHNVFADTCVAMDEWVQHPHAHTALDDILPCVDAATAEESLNQTKEVTFQLVNVVNNVIANVSNRNFRPDMAPLYYNQSGPLAPILCNPFNPDFTNRTCTVGEANFDNAAQTWKKYVCIASGPAGAEVCASVGRFTPDVYSQLLAATNVSSGLYLYGPFLTDLQDCTFVRETFSTISSRDCPGLGQYSRAVYIGLALVSGAVALSLLFWVIYARERRHRKYNKELSSSTTPLVRQKP